jgi:hypothetical protein
MDMEWLWIAAAVAAGLVFGACAGCYVGFKAASAGWQEANVSLRRNLSEDQARELSTFRRELANYLVRRDPDRFLHLYNKARVEEAEIERATKASNEIQLAAIADKYPWFSELDFVSTLEHVLYADSLHGRDIDEIESQYLTLVRFHALKRNVNDAWRERRPATSERAEEHLYKYIRQIKDTKFHQRIDAAKQEFDVFRRDRPLDQFGKDGAVYETNRLAVYYVSHFAENRYGFHFKDTDEFAIYSFFVTDPDPDVKIYRNYYRSNSLFKDEEYLDCLRIDEPI